MRLFYILLLFLASLIDLGVCYMFAIKEMSLISFVLGSSSMLCIVLFSILNLRKIKSKLLEN